MGRSSAGGLSWVRLGAEFGGLGGFGAEWAAFAARLDWALLRPGDAQGFSGLRAADAVVAAGAEDVFLELQQGA